MDSNAVEIVDIINKGNQELTDIYRSADKQLADHLKRGFADATDYKSINAKRLEETRQFFNNLLTNQPK
jgi:hypothetical protein